MGSSLFFYIISEILSLILFFVSCRVKKNNRFYSKVLLAASMTPFTLINCLRARTVGTDYSVYEWAYELIIKDSAYAHEWLGGFFYVFKFFSYICSYQLALAITNTITTVILFLAIYKHEEKPTLALAVLFAFCVHLQTLNQFRQALALSLCLLNIDNARKQNIKKFAAIQALATIAHTSSIIFILTFFLAKKKFNKKSMIMYSLLGIGTIMAGSVIISLLSSTSYGQRYFGGEYDTSMDSSKIVLVIRLVILIGLLLMRKVCTSDGRKKTSILFHMAFICMLLQLLAIKSYIFARLTTYYYLAYIFLIPESVTYLRITEKQKMLITVVIIIALLIYKIVYFQKMGPGAGIDNYKFIWNV